MIPGWLPRFCETDGVWEEVVAALYVVFRRDIVDNPPLIDGVPVWIDRRISDGFEESFWHLITRTDHASGDRQFDPRRAERLSWCGALLRNSNSPDVRRWRFRDERDSIRLYLWYEDGDYVVILEEKAMRRGGVYFLATAYYVDGDSQRRSLNRKYEKREP
jgi:hypothetical protein